MRRAFSLICQTALSIPLFNKVMTTVAYEQKRLLRRRVEERLRAAGLYPDVVMQGPLKGTRFPPGYASCRFEKIIGSYEAETHAWLDELIARGGFTSIVNIGAAEGSYACGLARHFPEIPIFAFEANEALHPAIREMAALNDVEGRLRLAGRCEPESLVSLDAGNHALVVCDVEGYEVRLLDPERVPWMRTASLFVELHDCLLAGSSEQVIRRFEPTHDIRKLSSKGHDYSAYPSLEGLTFPEIYAMILEDRPAPQDWMLATPKLS
ncbi:MAG TPA: hypothetical protein DIT64_11835 [Verrucomicrobiales bacterium]|nr:hypothetical protein [Verrucomicrobiales bacterium]